ncbi:hypothetical protein ACH4L5_07445 [Streptomyces sp. NPDC017405]|uniref:hypothetical protein n=1 Tax=unclassified Streptomyces TaxID=2593676 RepID=UPI0037928B87
MPVPRALAVRPTAPAVVSAPAEQRPQAAGSASSPVHAPSNAAVTAALAGAAGPVTVPPPVPGRPPLAAQDMLGNGAVAAAGRAGTGAGPEATAVAPPGRHTEAQAVSGAGTEAEAAPGAGAQVKARPGPEADPKFVSLKKDVQHKKRALAASHPPPRAEATSAQEASVPPKDDAEAQGKTANAEKMNEAKPKEFDKDAFIRAVEKAIADKAPKNLDEADKFAGSGKADEVRAEVHGKVGEGRSDSAEQIATTTAAPPDTSAAVPKKVVPMSPDRPPGTPPAPDAAQAVPDRLPPSATDLSAGPAQVNRRMAAAQVTETQLRTSNEPAFTHALGEKKTAEQHSHTTPARLRAHETAQLHSSTAQASRLGAAALGAMGAQRVRTGQQVHTGKSGAKSRDEEKRAQVTALLQGVFDTMKKDVEAILGGLDTLVDEQFTRGEKAARDAFTAEHRQKMDEYKDRRYSGATGKLRWLRDAFAGLPAEADRIFETARDTYVRRMRQVISEIAGTIGTELNRAKARIAQGRTEMRDAVRRLPDDLRALGRQAAAEFTDKFAALTQTVDDKGTELVDTLATKYTEALKAVDDEVAAEQEKNKGLVAKAVDAVKAVVDTILELKRLLLAVLAKAAQAVMLILKDPIGFLRNLVSAVGAGLRQFLANIGRHLQQGILSWLLGKTAEAGIALPATFDTQGVVKMLAGLLGLTWQNIRARITRKVPEPAVAAAETAVPLLAEVRRRGVAAMWEDLQTRVGDLRKQLLDHVIAYVTPTLVVAGIMWVISLLNPASAFVRAVKLIIDFVRFIVTQARQIFEFVNAVLDAVIAIARGGTGGVPALIERALARSIPVLLGVLAAVLGVGGIAGRVRTIVQRLSAPVDKAVDWVIDKIVGLVKKLWARLKPAFDRKNPKKRGPERDRPGRPRGRGPGRRRKRRDDRRRPRRGRRPDRRRKRPDERSEAAKQRALDAAVRDATRLLGEEGATVKTVRRGLPAIRKRHGLTRIKLVRETKEKYHIDLAINPTARTRPEDLGEKFPYEIKKIAPDGGRVETTPLSRVIKKLRKITVPMRGADSTVGFVVNMAATPGEITADVASRYLDEAWQDSKGNSAEAMALTRVAVVIGINTFERLDRNSAKAGGKAGILAAMDRIAPKDGQLLGVFGFLWTPRWTHREGREVALSEVRHAYAQLSHREQEAAIAANESGWRDGKLPYGVFRGEVLGHPFTEQAVRILKAANTRVHIVSQDADTGVAAASGVGVLRAYQQVLDSMKRHPLLTIGGYHFEGFKWGEKDHPHMRQMTLLSNELDRAIRKAITEEHPEMLYPTEPNMLIKAWDAKGAGGVFQDARARGLLAVQGQLFGLRGAEGRMLRIRLMELFGTDFAVAYAPEASTGTSPLPENEDRALAVRPRAVELASEGKMRKRGSPPDKELTSRIRVSHRAYAVILQSQTTASAHNLTRELLHSNPILSQRVAAQDKATERFQRTLRKKTFEHVENVILLMADNPGLTEGSDRIQGELQRLGRDVNGLLDSMAVRDDEHLKQAVERADAIAREVISALTAPQLEDLWTRLRKVLDDIMSAFAERNRGGGQ